MRGSEHDMGVSRRFFTIVACGLAAAAAMPAAAQFSDSYTFLQGVKDRDGDKVMPLVDKPGAPVLNVRDPNTGETAVHIVVKRHDMTWLGFLLGKGAQPDLKDRAGNTPLLVAAQTGDADAARLLIEVGANVNAINASGETPLILAVHARDTVLARVLVANGANPKLRDTIAGKSAADYAAEDSRGAAIVRILADAKPKGPSAVISGPVRR